MYTDLVYFINIKNLFKDNIFFYYKKTLYKFIYIILIFNNPPHYINKH